MGLEAQAIQKKARIRANGLETVEIDWPDAFLESWRKAASEFQTDGSTQGALVTREICTDVLGLPDTDAYIDKTRRQIADWIANGIVERVKTVRLTIAGNRTQHAYRLIEQDSQQEMDKNGK